MRVYILSHIHQSTNITIDISNSRTNSTQGGVLFV